MFKSIGLNDVLYMDYTIYKTQSFTDTSNLVIKNLSKSESDVYINKFYNGRPLSWDSGSYFIEIPNSYLGSGIKKNSLHINLGNLQLIDDGNGNLLTSKEAYNFLYSSDSYNFAYSIGDWKTYNTSSFISYNKNNKSLRCTFKNIEGLDIMIFLPFTGTLSVDGGSNLSCKFKFKSSSIENINLYSASLFGMFDLDLYNFNTTASLSQSADFIEYEYSLSDVIGYADMNGLLLKIPSFKKQVFDSINPRSNVNDTLYFELKDFIITQQGAETEQIVGNVFYENGIIIINDSDFIHSNLILNNIANFTFESSVKYKERKYILEVLHNELNGTENISKYINKDYKNGILLSEPAQYMSGVGLYNSDNELLMIGKFPNPIPKDTFFDTTIILKLLT